jgi:hypothetical protein
MKAQNVEPGKELFSNEDDYRAYRDNFRPNGGMQMQKYPRCQPYQTFFFFVTDDEDQQARGFANIRIARKTL